MLWMHEKNMDLLFISKYSTTDRFWITQTFPKSHTHTVRRLIQYVWIGFYFHSKCWIQQYTQMHTLKEVAYQQLIIKIQSVFSPYIGWLICMNFEGIKKDVPFDNLTLSLNANQCGIILTEKIHSLTYFCI